MGTCNFLNCDSASRTKGLCPRHYEQQRQGRAQQEINNEKHQECSIPHCQEEATSRAVGALCQPHYQLRYRGIDPHTRIIGSKIRKVCLFEGCHKRAETKGVCRYHSRRIRTGREAAPEGCDIQPNAPCSFEGCQNPYETRGLCHSHYEQLRNGGNLRPVRDYGKYTKGEHICDVKNCRLRAVSTGLCEKHKTLQTQYKLTPEEFLEVWKTPVCSNRGCGETKRLHMDHDHDSGKFRGLLCGSCNSGLGFFRDDFKRLEGIIEYLSQHKPR